MRVLVRKGLSQNIRHATTIVRDVFVPKFLCDKLDLQQRTLRRERWSVVSHQQRVPVNRSVSQRGPKACAMTRHGAGAGKGANSQSPQAGTQPTTSGAVPFHLPTASRP